jgi:hypothetical protein
MATYLGSKMASAGIQPKFLPTGDLAVYSQYSVATALNLNDTINMLQIPGAASASGAFVTGVTFDVDKLDSNATPTILLSVGDAVLNNRFIKNSNIGQAGGFAIPNQNASLGFNYTTLTTIIVTCAAAAATAITGTTGPYIRLLMNYSFDP